jgi:uncharacterized protein
MYKNKLINEKSPYLLQHSHNPVNWYAWNEESLKLAEDTNKPIFLSVGYSTCYWCHVMERESFENENIANLLNKYFVNIKVDREERPDIDRVYMTALQSMTGSGGWPMNMFLTPDLKPFYGATYISPKEKYGHAGFEDIIEQINTLWTTKRQELIASSEKIFDILNSKLKEKSGSTIKIDDRIFNKTFDTIKNIFDYDNGGFGIGNKFPRPVVIDFLLSYYYQSKNTESLDMAIFTLKKMCEGGLYDQLGGGFHRYTVDVYWRVPHFEKMLYDQAQIAYTLFDVYSITNKEYFFDYALSTLNYVLENLTDKNGGFYSAEDAESAIEEYTPNYKEEGYYYLWEKKQLEDILGKNNSSIFCYAYGIKHNGNTISDPHNVFKNKNVIYLSNDIYDTSKAFDKSPDEIEDILNNCKNILFDERKKRPRPHLDDKILTSWNSLMISAFAKGYNITKEKKFKETAIKCSSFILQNLWNEKENIFYHRYRDGEVKFLATLDDYAFFIKALLDLYEMTFEEKYLEYAFQFFEIANKKFYDKENSGFFDVESSASDIILKTKDIYDGAEPSGNSIIIENAIRLGNITGNKYFFNIAKKSIEYFFTDIENLPFSSPQMIKNILFMRNPPKEIIITGNLQNHNLKEIIKYINGIFLPVKTFIYANKNIEEFSPYIKNIINDYNSTKIYVCENQSCKLPVSNIVDLKKILQ